MVQHTAYLAPEGFLPELLRELGESVASVHERLVLANGPERRVAWCANVWRDPQTIRVESIGDAASKLRAIQRNWALYSAAHHRRAALIAEKLPKVSAKPLTFGTPAPSAPLGSWTLLAPDTVLAAANCSSPFVNGEVTFLEDRSGPPNRAYLKLWEALTLAGEMPRPGQACLDLGSSPGGWTWVLQRTGASVVSVDKAPLDPAVGALERIDYRQMSAFALEPKDVGEIDWLCADIACYPARLFTLIQKWLASGRAKRFVCTLKFQGDTDFDAIAKFAALPGRLLHLHHNKHELTWLKV